MIAKALILFCDNEHGMGNVTFPDVRTGDGYELEQYFLNSAATVRDLRLKAKEAGWGRVNGGDYCPQCMETGV